MTTAERAAGEEESFQTGSDEQLYQFEQESDPERFNHSRLREDVREGFVDVCLDIG